MKHSKKWKYNKNTIRKHKITIKKGGEKYTKIEKKIDTIEDLLCTEDLGLTDYDCYKLHHYKINLNVLADLNHYKKSSNIYKNISNNQLFLGFYKKEIVDEINKDKKKYNIYDVFLDIENNNDTNILPFYYMEGNTKIKNNKDDAWKTGVRDTVNNSNLAWRKDNYKSTNIYPSDIVKYEGATEKYKSKDCYEFVTEYKVKNPECFTYILCRLEKAKQENINFEDLKINEYFPEYENERSIINQFERIRMTKSQRSKIVDDFLNFEIIKILNTDISVKSFYKQLNFMDYKKVKSAINVWKKDWDNNSQDIRFKNVFFVGFSKPDEKKFRKMIFIKGNGWYSDGVYDYSPTYKTIRIDKSIIDPLKNKDEDHYNKFIQSLENKIAYEFEEVNAFWKKTILLEFNKSSAEWYNSIFLIANNARMHAFIGKYVNSTVSLVSTAVIGGIGLTGGLLGAVVSKIAMSAISLGIGNFSTRGGGDEDFVISSDYFVHQNITKDQLWEFHFGKFDLTYIHKINACNYDDGSTSCKQNKETLKKYQISDNGLISILTDSYLVGYADETTPIFLITNGEYVGKNGKKYVRNYIQFVEIQETKYAKFEEKNDKSNDFSYDAQKNRIHDITKLKENTKVILNESQINSIIDHAFDIDLLINIHKTFGKINTLGENKSTLLCCGVSEYTRNFPTKYIYLKENGWFISHDPNDKDWANQAKAYWPYYETTLLKDADKKKHQVYTFFEYNWGDVVLKAEQCYKYDSIHGKTQTAWFMREIAVPNLSYGALALGAYESGVDIYNGVQDVQSAYAQNSADESQLASTNMKVEQDESQYNVDEGNLKEAEIIGNKHDIEADKADIKLDKSEIKTDMASYTESAQNLADFVDSNPALNLFFGINETAVQQEINSQLQNFQSTIENGINHINTDIVIPQDVINDLQKGLSIATIESQNPDLTQEQITLLNKLNENYNKYESEISSFLTSTNGTNILESISKVSITEALTTIGNDLKNHTINEDEYNYLKDIIEKSKGDSETPNFVEDSSVFESAILKSVSSQNTSNFASDYSTYGLNDHSYETTDFLFIKNYGDIHDLKQLLEENKITQLQYDYYYSFFITSSSSTSPDTIPDFSIPPNFWTSHSTQEILSNISNLPMSQVEQTLASDLAAGQINNSEYAALLTMAGESAKSGNTPDFLSDNSISDSISSIYYSNHYNIELHNTDDSASDMIDYIKSLEPIIDNQTVTLFNYLIPNNIDIIGEEIAMDSAVTTLYDLVDVHPAVIESSKKLNKPCTELNKQFDKINEKVRRYTIQLFDKEYRGKIVKQIEENEIKIAALKKSIMDS